MEQLLVIQTPQFKRSFQHWQEQWNKCIHDEETYFEGD
jgi:hypothetical protein